MRLSKKSKANVLKEAENNKAIDFEEFKRGLFTPTNK